jgi:hypothetical protein
MKKVIDYALLERGLLHNPNQPISLIRNRNDSHRPAAGMQRPGAPLPLVRTRKEPLLEGTRSVPEFGKLVPNKVAELLAKRAREYMEWTEAREAERRRLKR